VATGWLSDVLARRAASAAVAGSAEVFRAIGLQQAMLVVPAMALLLAGVLFAGAATAKRDIDGSSAWINAPAGAGGTR
jgi:hypothetical protein